MKKVTVFLPEETYKAVAEYQKRNGVGVPMLLRYMFNVQFAAKFTRFHPYYVEKKKNWDDKGRSPIWSGQEPATTHRPYDII